MKIRTCLLLLPLAFAMTGCTAFDRITHELQPHRLWRINRGPAPGREDAGYFSVHDTEAETASRAEPLGNENPVNWK